MTSHRSAEKKETEERRLLSIFFSSVSSRDFDVPCTRVGLKKHGYVN